MAKIANSPGAGAGNFAHIILVLEIGFLPSQKAQFRSGAGIIHMLFCTHSQVWFLGEELCRFKLLLAHNGVMKGKAAS
jgi:hypothetical protein